MEEFQKDLESQPELKKHFDHMVTMSELLPTLWTNEMLACLVNWNAEDHSRLHIVLRSNVKILPEEIQEDLVKVISEIPNLKIPNSHLSVPSRTKHYREDQVRYDLLRVPWSIFKERTLKLDEKLHSGQLHLMISGCEMDPQTKHSISRICYISSDTLPTPLEPEEMFLFPSQLGNISKRGLL